MEDGGFLCGEGGVGWGEHVRVSLVVVWGICDGRVEDGMGDQIMLPDWARWRVGHAPTRLPIKQPTLKYTMHVSP